jgi:RimJ/RimL family protein N-acetyltransferase
MANLFETTHLSVREFTLDDSDFVYQLVNTPGWKRFIGDRNVNDTAGALTYIKTALLDSYAKNGYGGWRVSIRETGEPIGMCGLFIRDFLEYPELGFAFMPHVQGRGFAYESATGAIDHIRNAYPLKALYATTTLDNERSQRLLERCGFIRQENILIPGKTEESALFHLHL